MSSSIKSHMEAPLSAVNALSFPGSIRRFVEVVSETVQVQPLQGGGGLPPAITLQGQALLIR